MTVDDMLVDYWAHHFADNPNASQEEFEDPDFEQEVQELLNNPDDWEPIS